MSRHEGVSCDICLKSNFRGRRYKCLICYDYDLCARCYEEGATSTRHSTDHPMQCILTRTDFDLFYAGETYGTDQPQSFTCPYCKKMGFSDATLVEHVTAEHIDTGLEVVCPVCASLPGGDPNLITDDFAGHLSLEHRAQARGDLISFLDEPSSIRHGGVRRIPHSGSGSRALGGPRSRRSNMHFSSAGTLSALSPAGRDSVDPISELLSQLTGVRRGAPQPSQLQQLQMQIQLERQQVTAARQNLERLPRRQAHPVASTSSSSVIGGAAAAGGVPTMAAVVAGTASAVSGNGAMAQAQHGVVSASSLGGREISITSNPLQMAVAAAAAAAAASSANAAGAAGGGGGGGGGAGGNQSQFLLTRFMTPTLLEPERAEMEHSRADRSQYVQGLLLSTMSNLHIAPIDEPTGQSATESQQLPTNDATAGGHQSDDAREQPEQQTTEQQQKLLQQQQHQQQSQPQLTSESAGATINENVPPQQFCPHYGRGGGGLLDAAAAAKLKNAGKPPSQGARAAAGRLPTGQQQQQQSQQKSRELKAVASKESHDSSR